MSNNQGNRPPAKKNQSENSAKPTEVVERFLDNQSKDLQLRARELELKKQSDKHNYDYAQAALAAQAKDRESGRRNNKSIKRYQYIFGGVALTVVFGFLALALFLDKDAVALEIIKASVFLLSGGAGGYAVGKSAQSKNGSESAPEPE